MGALLATSHRCRAGTVCPDSEAQPGPWDRGWCSVTQGPLLLIVFRSLISGKVPGPWLSGYDTQYTAQKPLISASVPDVVPTLFFYLYFYLITTRLIPNNDSYQQFALPCTRLFDCRPYYPSHILQSTLLYSYNFLVRVHCQIVRILKTFSMCIIEKLCKLLHTEYRHFSNSKGLCPENTTGSQSCTYSCYSIDYQT